MFKEFAPHPLVKGGHMQTIIAHMTSPAIKPQFTSPLYLNLGDGDQILLQLDMPPHVASHKPLVITFHGLGGCSESQYNLRIARRLNDLGYPVIRFNHRGCGPQARKLARKIYHAGSTDEILATISYVAKHFKNRQILLVGFSLSANALLLTLESKDLSKYSSVLTNALAVCPPIDLEKCSIALSKKQNTHLDWYYTKRLKALTDERSEFFEDCNSVNWPAKMNLRTFDEIFTAPEGGFASLEDYYSKSSSKPNLARISLPTDIIAAKDDPIIPVTSFEDMELGQQVNFHLTKSGGHMGYISSKMTRFNDRRWLDEAVIDWVEHYAH